MARFFYRAKAHVFGFEFYSSGLRLQVLSANQALIYPATLRGLLGLTSPPKVLRILDYHWEQPNNCN